MNKSYAIVAFAIITIAAALGILSWLLPTKGDAEEINNKYFIEITNCSKISSDSERELKELFKATDYKSANGGQAFLIPIVKVTDTAGKKVSFGIPIYGVNYWRYKWANPDLYLYPERIDDQEKFWAQTNTEEKFEKIKTILNRDNSIANTYSTSSYVIDLAQVEEINNRSFNSITAFRKAIDKKIKAGEIKPGDLVPIYVKCFNVPAITTTAPISLGSEKNGSIKISADNNKTDIITGFRRVGESNKFVWSKKLAEIASQLTLEMQIDGEIIESHDATGETEYCFSPGNKVTGKFAVVTLVVKIDRTKYSLIGDTKVPKSNYNCTCQ